MQMKYLLPAPDSASSSPCPSGGPSPLASPLGGGGESGGPTPYSDVTGLKTVKKDGKVLRPMNAFMLWAKEQRRTLIANGYVKKNILLVPLGANLFTFTVYVQVRRSHCVENAGRRLEGPLGRPETTVSPGG